MKVPLTIAALICIAAVAGCKAGEPGKVEKSVVNEIKHEVTTRTRSRTRRMQRKREENTSSIIARSATGSTARTPACLLPRRCHRQWLTCPPKTSKNTPMGN
jgi:hypothetical protein